MTSPSASKRGAKAGPSSTSARGRAAKGGAVGHVWARFARAGLIGAAAHQGQKRPCSSRSARNMPVNWVVMVETPGFCTPRIAMHLCSASIITATPRGLRISSIASAICGSGLLRLQAAREDVDHAGELREADHAARAAQ